VATRVFIALMKHDSGVRALVTDVIPEGFRWVRFLPAESVREFVVDLVETLRAVDDLDTTAPVAQVIIEWKHTAEIYADPELLAILTRDLGEDYGPVPRPEVGEWAPSAVTGLPHLRDLKTGMFGSLTPTRPRAGRSCAARR
jgi:hypothetical protein